MVTPEQLGRLSAVASRWAGSVEVACAIEAAAALAAADLSSPSDIARRGAELAARLAAVSGDDAVARALAQDLEALFSWNAETESAASGAGGAAAQSVLADAAARSSSARSELASILSRSESAVRMSARELYLRECTRAGLNARSGNMTRQQAVADSVRRMAEMGLYCSEYTRRDGTTVRVPVDVGVRRAVEDMAQGMLTKQVISIASTLGENLVQVSSHAGARDSHAAWHGRVYMLDGGTRERPNFYSACRVGDMVNGYGGYNCRHTMAIYREGEKPLWDPDPTSGTGYTNDEVYALKQRQRAHESSIRKLKRVKQVLDSQGLDSRQVDVEINAHRAALRRLVGENGRVLARDSWREQVSAAERTVVQEGEPLVHGRQPNTPSAVDRKAVNSKEYHDKFDSMPFKARVRESLYKQAGRLLEDADGKQHERMAAVSARTGDVIADNMDDPPIDRMAGLSSQKIERVKRVPDGVIYIHNHPNSTEPSFTDIHSAAQDWVVANVAVCHDGTVYTIIGKVGTDIIESVYNRFVEKAKESHPMLADSAEIGIIALESMIAANEEIGMRWFDLSRK